MSKATLSPNGAEGVDLHRCGNALRDGNTKMSAQFDKYRSNYVDVVEDSIRFSGLKHSFFQRAKIRALAGVCSQRNLSDRSDQIRALDVGCGIGALHPFGRDLLPNLSGCDISGESIARAKQDNPWVDYHSYHPPELPYANDTFDLAFTVCVVHHVPPADRPSFFSEMKRVVRPGGVICVIEHNPFNPLTRLSVLRCPFDADAVLLNRWQAEKMLRSAGLKDSNSRHFLLMPLANRVSNTAERWLSRLPLGAQYVSSATV